MDIHDYEEFSVVWQKASLKFLSNRTQDLKCANVHCKLQKIYFKSSHLDFDYRTIFGQRVLQEIRPPYTI